MIITTDKIRIEGNSLVIRMQPATGLLALTSFVSTEVNISQDAFFNKTFRYSINGVVFTEWITLTPQAIIDIPVTSTDTLVIELNYLKVDSVEGESELDVTNIEIGATKQTPIAQNYFDKTVFKEFFDSDSVEVLSWYINVLDKLYQKGIIPNYIDRLNDFEDPSDFIEFWKSITTFFSYFVNYARKFQKFYESETLLSEYIDERGLRVSIENDLTELNHLMINFYQQVASRGTNKIIDKIEEGEVVDGELLRLIWYKPEDEILFNLHKPEHFGWNIGNSSPLYRGLYLNDNANKYGDKSFQPHDITKYSGATLVTDGELKVLSVTSALGSSEDKIKISNEIDYEFSFLIKKEESALLTVRLEAFDKDLNSISLKSHKDGAAKSDFFTEINLSRDDKYLLVKLFLFNKNKSNFSEDVTEIHQGENLTSTEDTVWIAPFIELTGGSALIYGVRFLPTNTSFSHGLIQVNNWISCSLINRNNSLTLREIKEFTKRYLIPYNSHIEIVENNQLSDSGTEEVEDTFSWIGSGQYCERFLWIGDESTAYCEQEATTTTTTVAPTTTTTVAPTTTTTVAPTTTTTTTTSEFINLYSVNSLSSTTATANGELNYSGIIDKGFVWSLHNLPTRSDFNISCGNSNGYFNAILTDLTEGINYYVRAYVTTPNGTTYSNETMFTQI